MQFLTKNKKIRLKTYKYRKRYTSDREDKNAHHTS